MTKLIAVLLCLCCIAENDNSKIQADISELDTTEFCFSCLMDTGRNLFLYGFAYPDQYFVGLSCIVKRGNQYSDTGFFLDASEIVKLDSSNFLEEFRLNSSYFKRVRLIYLDRKEKRLFKGFRFKTFKRKIVYNSDSTQYGYGCSWPLLNKSEYPYKVRKKLVSNSEGYILKVVKIIH
ncbi:MAG: hypothetical protein JNM67_00355 [Bacteroidetes bacterium]|nr:hypothetical protein [Bacteroidota bacterium]